MTTDAIPFNPTLYSTLHVPDHELHLVPQLTEYLRPDNGLLPDPLHLTPLHGVGPRTTPPSGWFSPSTHPTWPLDKLVQYARDPASVPPDKLEGAVLTSALMGSFFHDALRIVFRHMGIQVEPEEKVCPLCKLPRGYTPGQVVCNEHAVFDHVLRRRGHIDNVLRLPSLQSDPVGIDLKTSAHHAIKHIRNHDPEPYIIGSTALRAKYYGQLQEYMALKGWQRMILLFVGMGFPWEMREVVIERDQPYIDRLIEKYTTARRLAEA